MRSGLALLLGCTALACHFLAALAVQPQAADNDPPKVTITAPVDNGSFQWNSVVPYAIDVTDREDGKTEFEEIAANEVLLKIACLPDASRKDKYLLDLAKADDQPLRRMSAANCLTCHAARTKLIGPSFDQIAKRYPNTPATVESLAKKVLTGATGIWGNVAMPPHPDLKIDQAREMVGWILNNSLDPDQSFVVGIEGAFRTREKTDNDAGTGIYVLTASYMDHGLKDRPQSSKQGQHTVVLKLAQ